MNIAVVTGASSGIGRRFAKMMDNEKLDEVWAVALDQQGLDELKGEMNTPIKTFAIDLTDLKNLESFKNKLAEVKPNINWLVNASGFGKFGRYDEIPVEQSMNMIDLNCRALVAMTEYCLPYMTAGARIVEIASVAGFQPIPYINVYGATKAFVVSYARALNVELKSRKISVTCVCPFWTKTAFFNRAEDPKNKIVSYYAALYEPQDVVNKAYKDAVKRKELSICGFIARSQVRLVKVLPPKMIMNTWLSQQKLKKKYKNK